MRLSALGPIRLAAACVLMSAAAPVGGEPWHKGPKDAAREWFYPKAERFGTDREGKGIYHAKYTTPDRVANVVAWYKANRIKLTGDEGVSWEIGSEHRWASMLSDSAQPGTEARGRGPARPVEVVSLLGKSRGATVSVVVSRATGEERTHIALTYLDD